MAKQILSGCVNGPGPNGEIITSKDGTVKPLKFLGGTVLSFTASLGIGPTEESTLDLEIINDCKVESDPTNPQGDYFLGNVRIGSAVFFNTCEAIGINLNNFNNDPDNAPCFNFGGILQSYTAKQSSSGLIFSARVVDPRSLLENVTIVVSSILQGPRKHRNYYNAYSYYEQSSLDPTEIFDNINTGPAGNVTKIVKPGGTKNVVDIDGYVKGDIDCNVVGTSRSDERGMPYVNIIHALNNMNPGLRPLVYSSNYGSRFVPPTQGRDNTIVTAENIHFHQDNVFELDLSGLPNNISPELRAPGPSITLLELITNVCESTGYEFIVTLKDQGANKPALIQIETKNVKNIPNPDSFRSTIIKYNGSAIDLSYGKELKLDKNRSMLIGEQKHVMYESSNILMYFGIDKENNPILPYNIENLEDDDPRKIYIDAEDRRNQKTCGWFIDIEIDELNGALRCPLYDYRPESKDQIVSRKITVSEFNIRAALSSYDIWEKFIFNTLTMEDFAQLIRYNFPELEDTVGYALLRQIAANLNQENDNPPDHVQGAGDKGIADGITDANNKLALATIEQRAAYIKQIHDFIANIGKTYYGRKYLVEAADHVCVGKPDFKNVNYFGPDNLNKIQPNITTYVDPCTKKATDLVNNAFYPRTYSHIPTNDGGWIEYCGDILGITKDSNGKHDPDRTIYLDFFRKDDGRVGPIARIDNKFFVSLKNEKNAGIIIDDSVQNDQESDPPSVYGGIVVFAKTEDENGQQAGIANGKFYEGLCGSLDISGHDKDNYIVIREYGICAPPPTKEEIEEDPDKALTAQAYFDLPASIFLKFTVDENLVVVSGCREIEKTTIEKEFYVPCCGYYQNRDPETDCYLSLSDNEIIKANEDCQKNFTSVEKEILIKKCDTVYIPITFDAPLLTKPCDGLNTLSLEAAQLAFLIAVSGNLQNNPEELPEEPTEQLKKQYTNSVYFCNDVNRQAVEVAMASLDYTSTNNNKFYASAYTPDLVAIPLKSNNSTYGPYYSKNFWDSSGGIDLIQDNDICPWVFGSKVLMDKVGNNLATNNQNSLPEIETGTVNYPYWPEIKLGFLENGPNLTRVNCSFGSNGVSTNYTFQTYTPQFAKLANLEKQALKEGIKNQNRISRIAREKERKLDILKRKTIGPNNPAVGNIILQKPLNEQGTLHRILVGESYPFTQLWDPNYITIGEGEDQEIVQSGYTITGTGDRTIVGTETLQKSVLELRYNYHKKAFMSLDGLYSPVSMSGDGDLPMYAKYSGQPISAVGTFVNPNPPVKVSGSVVNDIDINQYFLNPLTNNFGSGEHHHVGDGAGHSIDIVGRGSGVPESGMIMNLYGQSNWANRYSDDYRFLGLKGPLVLHAWGYDTQGKPIPNAIDDVDLIHNSGIFRTKKPLDSGVSPSGYIGLQDYFLDDWLHKSSTWPVAPVDLRFDRSRGVWVSPVQHKIVVVETSGSIPAYGSGDGFLINKRNDRSYNEEIYDGSGNLVTASDASSNASIIIEDRIGISTDANSKSYAYFDSFTSTYLLMGNGGGSNIKIGKFCNQWPSLSNVKDPANAVKKVILYEPATSGCNNGETCPWKFDPVMTTVSGVQVPVVVEAVNLFSNVASAEYQTKWCAILQQGTTYILLAAEC